MHLYNLKEPIIMALEKLLTESDVIGSVNEHFRSATYYKKNYGIGIVDIQSEFEEKIEALKRSSGEAEYPTRLVGLIDDFDKQARNNLESDTRRLQAEGILQRVIAGTAYFGLGIYGHAVDSFDRARGQAYRLRRYEDCIELARACIESYQRLLEFMQDPEVLKLLSVTSPGKSLSRNMEMALEGNRSFFTQRGGAKRTLTNIGFNYFYIANSLLDLKAGLGELNTNLKKAVEHFSKAGY